MTILDIVAMVIVVIITSVTSVITYVIWKAFDGRVHAIELEFYRKLADLQLVDQKNFSLKICDAWIRGAEDALQSEIEYREAAEHDLIQMINGIYMILLGMPNVSITPEMQSKFVELRLTVDEYRRRQELYNERMEKDTERRTSR